MGVSPRRPRRRSRPGGRRRCASWRPGDDRALHGRARRRRATWCSRTAARDRVDGALPEGLPFGYHRLHPRGGGETLLVRQPAALLPARRPPRLGVRGPAVRGALARKLGHRRPGGSRRGSARWTREPGRRRGDGQSADGADARRRRSNRAPTTRRAGATATRCSCASRSCRAGRTLPEDLRARLTSAGTALNARPAASTATPSSGSSRRRSRRCSPASAASDGFDWFCAGEGQALTDFATYAALAERHGKDWRRWPDGHRRPDGAGVARLPRRRGARASASTPGLQWLLDAQLARASREIAVVHDLPIGLDVAGADAWCWQDVLARDVSVGAPARRVQRQRPGLGPDARSSRGRLRAARYRPFIETIRAMLRARGRPAHRPRDGPVPAVLDPARAGRARAAPTCARAPTSCWRSSRSRAMRARAFIIGEDLGTVEAGVRERLAEQQHAVVPAAVVRAEAARATSRSWRCPASRPTTCRRSPGLWTGADLAALKRIGIDAQRGGNQGAARQAAPAGRAGRRRAGGGGDRGHPPRAGPGALADPARDPGRRRRGPRAAQHPRHRTRMAQLVAAAAAARWRRSGAGASPPPRHRPRPQLTLRPDFLTSGRSL